MGVRRAVRDDWVSGSRGGLSVGRVMPRSLVFLLAIVHPKIWVVDCGLWTYFANLSTSSPSFLYISNSDK